MNALVKTILYIAFDLDNTLIQSLAHKREALYATLYRHVIKYEVCAFGDEFIKRTEELAKNLPGLVHGWQRYFGLPYSWTEKIYAEANTAMIYNVVKGYERDAILIDGLERLKDKGFILALHSHSSEEYCTQVLHTMGLTHVFPQQNIYHRGRVPHYKSEIEAHLFVQESLQKQYGDNALHIMVDDMVENLRAAHYAGSKTVLNGSPRPADAIQIDFDYPDIHQTLDALNTFTPECLLRKTG